MVFGAIKPLLSHAVLYSLRRFDYIGVLVTKRKAFHSINSWVYHTTKKCPYGGRIHVQNRRSGKGGCWLCPWCARNVVSS